MAPESFETHARASASTPASVASVVRPHRSMTRARSAVRAADRSTSPRRGRVAAAADQHAVRAALGRRASATTRSEVLGQPALGGAVRRARRQHHERARARPTRAVEQPRAPRVARRRGTDDARLERPARHAERPHEVLVVRALVQAAAAASATARVSSDERSVAA